MLADAEMPVTEEAFALKNAKGTWEQIGLNQASDVTGLLSK